MLRRISWTVLRQLEAVRESVAFTLKDGAVDRGTGKPDAYFVEWLESQGVEPFFFNVMPEGRLTLALLQTIEQAVRGHGVDLNRIHFAGARSRFAESDIGPNRSSTGWDRLPNFITSSALIRVLGAMEQFELDVLKALLYYRPGGKGSSAGLEFVDADLSIIAEEPDADGRYARPALWSWIKKPAENAVERRKLYKSVFDIDCFPPKFGQAKPSEIKAYYQRVYEQRNALAHGRSLVEVSLADYCKAEAFALLLVLHLSGACKERYALGV